MKSQFSLNIIYNNKHYSWESLVGLCEGGSYRSQPESFLSCLNIISGLLNKTLFVTADFTAIEYSSTTHTNLLALATSGSQGDPKTVLINEDNVVSHCDSFQKIIPLNKSSVWLNCMPLKHIGGLMIIYRCGFHGATMLLQDGFDERKIWHNINEFSVSHISLVPVMLSKLLDISKDAVPPATLKYVLIGGDRISDALFKRAKSLGWPVYLSYGMTECTSTVAIGTQPGCLDLLDGFEVCLSERGTLKLKGKMIAASYSNSEQEITTDDWFETHDLAKLDQRSLTILGRDDFAINSGGECLSVEYIEQLIEPAIEQSQGTIQDIAVGSVDNDIWGHSVAVLVCGSCDALQEWVDLYWESEGIASKFKPRVFVGCDFIPRNEMGKVERFRVQELLRDN